MNSEKPAVKRIRRDSSVALLAEASTLKNSGLFSETSTFIPTLTFLSGEALGKELPIVRQQTTLGRGEESDVIIMDPSVSRKHVRLSCRQVVGKESPEEVRVVLQDLDSKNGTLVNYRPVRRAVLKPGDKICLGRVILKFEYRDLADRNFYEEIYRLATTDGLTGLLNKATITRALVEEMTKCARYRRQLSVVMLDLDDFKSLNDTFGHLMGDRILQSIATVMRKNMRCQDKAGRYGGEEFLLVLPETGLKGASLLAERIRAEVDGSVAIGLNILCRVSLSAGVSTYPLDGRNCENLLEHADAALYRAKALGKNRVELWQEAKSNDF